MKQALVVCSVAAVILANEVVSLAVLLGWMSLALYKLAVAIGRERNF